MSYQSSGRAQSYPVPVCGPAQPSRPNPAWGLNAQNHSKCILVMAALVLSPVSLRRARDTSGTVVCRSIVTHRYDLTTRDTLAYLAA